MASGTGVSVRIVTTEARFVALGALVQIFVGSGIADVGVYATVVPYWFNSSEFSGTGMEGVR